MTAPDGHAEEPREMPSVTMPGVVPWQNYCQTCERSSGGLWDSKEHAAHDPVQHVHPDTQLPIP